MRVLISGGAGYLGSVLVERLLLLTSVADVSSVTVLDNFMYRQVSLSQYCSNPNFDIVRGDARDYRLLKKLLPKFDVFIPLAAIVGAPLCESDRVAALTTNYEAVAQAIKEMSHEQRILVPITNSGYGNAGGEWCDENSPLNPVSFYGRTKVWAEQVVMERGNSISFRLATVFGMSPRMRLDLLLNDFTYRAVNDRAVTLFEANFKRNYIHVRDVASVFCFGIANFEKMRDKVYNVGLSDANLSKRELCLKIKEHIPQFVFNYAELGEDPDKRDYLVSNKRIEATGWRPSFSLDDGIEELMKGFVMLKNNQYGNY